MDHLSRFYKKSIVCLLFSMFFISNQAIFAQLEEGQSLDKIVAIVGKEIIMQSEINSQLAMMVQQNPQVNINDEDVKQKVLDALINDKLVLTKAKEDSLVATEDEVDVRWGLYLQRMVSQFGSEQRIESVYGMSLARIKSEYRDVIYNSILTGKITDQKFGRLKVTPRDVKEFFKMKKDSLQIIPEQVEISHIVKHVNANSTARKDAYKLALRIRDSILTGSDFAELAKRHSGDPVTAETGGDLGWFDKGKLFPEYEKAAFDLQEGQLSMPVETPFGYNIIQTIEKKETSILTRNILVKISQTDLDRNNVIKELKDLKEKYEAGTSTFEELAKRNSDDKNTRGFGGFLYKQAIDNLPYNLSQTISSLDVGGVSDPMPYMVDPSKPAYHIVLKKATIDSHTPNLKDDYKYVEQLTLRFKKMNKYAEWMEQLRATMYWEIKK